jgi:beta-1,4-mannosyltransferase
VRPQRTAIASVPPTLDTNPYLRLLYAQLAAHGIALVPGFGFRLDSLRHHDGPRTIIHFHWTHYAYRPPLPDGTELSAGGEWLALALFAARLAAARVMRYRIVWTVHQVTPHESHGLRDRLAATLLALAAAKLIVHDQHTADACRRLPVRASKIAIVPHASYIGVYPPGRNRAAARAALRLSGARFVFLSFGRIRRYKDLDLLLAAFAQTADRLPQAALLIAGASAEVQVVARVEAAAQRDPRITPILEFVPDDEVAELFAAADATVSPRGDGGTSGSLVLSMSLGRPVVAARRPSYDELLGGEEAGWLFTPGDAGSLAATLVRAADPVDAFGRGIRARERIAEHDWADIGRRTAAVMRG